MKPDPGPLVPELLQSPEGTQLAPDPPLKSEPESEDTQPAPDPPTEALEVQVKAEATTEDAACTGTATAGEGSHSTTTTTILLMNLLQVTPRQRRSYSSRLSLRTPSR